MSKKEIHKKYCDDCLKFQLGVCGGAQCHIPNLCEQPLCNKVRNELKELKMSKEKGCECCKQIWYVDVLDKKLKLCPNCYEYCKPLIDDLKINKLLTYSTD